MKVAVFGFGRFMVRVASLVKSLGHEPTVVTHEPDPHEGVHVPGGSHLIPAHEKFDDAEMVRNLAPDLIVSAGCRCLLGPDVLAVPRFGAVNLHESLLPKFRGRCPMNWALITGQRRTGVTLHYIDEGVDTGPIISQATIELDSEINIRQLADTSEKLACELLGDALPDIENGTVKSRPQTRTTSPAHFRPWPGRRPEDGELNRVVSEVAAHNLVRALTRPWPGAFFVARSGKKFYIWKSRRGIEGVLHVMEWTYEDLGVQDPKRFQECWEKENQ